MTDPALVERHGHTVLITLNRPEARNAVNAQTALIIGDALAEADADVDVRAIVITGSGSKAFCAGADLRAIAAGERLLPAGREAWGFAGFTQHFVSKPTIAAVNGFAMGGGTELVLASDLAVAAHSATFGLPEVKRGIIAAAGGAFRLPAQMPRKLGMHMLLTGDPVDAATALRYGLVNDVVPDAEVVDAALALADRIAANAPLAVQASKRIAYAAGGAGGTWFGEEPYWEVNAQESRAVRRSADALEGPRAFAEKRVPVWQGR